MTETAPHLVVLNGAYAGDVIVIDDDLPLVLGRRCGVALPEADLDDVHCQLFHLGETWYLQDFNTASGTWIGDTRVEGVRPVELGRAFRIGTTQLALVIDHPDGIVDVEPSTEEPLPAIVAEAAPLPAIVESEDELVEYVRDGPVDAIVEPAPEAPLEAIVEPAPPTPAPSGLPLPAQPSDEVAVPPPHEGPTSPVERHGAVGDYDILLPLGEGRTAQVFKAYDRRRRRVVALKLLLPKHRRDNVAVKRFLRGTKVMAKLRHPHIVRVLAAGHARGHVYASLEYVEGGDLAAFCESLGGQLPTEVALTVAGSLAAALAYAHERGVLHRGVSPKNVQIAPGVGAKLSGFGLARKASSKASKITWAGEVLTESLYAAPETLFDLDRVGPHSDVYGIGATLYHALTGQPPYEGHPVAAAERIREGQYRSPRELVPDLPLPVVGLLARCLAPEPEERYASAAELREALAGLQA